MRVMTRRSPQPLTCDFVRESLALEADGRVKSREHAEGQSVIQGEQEDTHLRSLTTDGRPLDARALSARDREDNQGRRQVQAADAAGKYEGKDLLSPFSPRARDAYRFELVGEETLWGHQTHLVRVSPRTQRKGSVAGTLNIDAERFVVLRALYTVAVPVDHMRWGKQQEQYELVGGVPVQSFYRSESAYRIFLVNRRFDIRFERRCR
jgi:hypothetical protein